MIKDGPLDRVLNLPRNRRLITILWDHNIISTELTDYKVWS